ncbi:hypothetical protein XfCFBP8082_01390 [Xylella fastidiosa subsp. fastidiosa]|nr:hypothetical protein [Xylella fastidiosa subsp. fastidiosa]QIS26671.1 hypothetical protein F7G16_11325 [Xylella fastidiosa]RWA45432.1 hypothetical protein XfCFBP8356_00030 [Xylella fastidiosa subsp. sandyi]RUA39131.1 hypothetical protein DX878_02400 [Xylella fastidiosa subsp. fastidiosa]RUA39433.1 hypothetical protein DX877_00030 [Xylella fastidiosa subsp. fastidiosa]
MHSNQATQYNPLHHTIAETNPTFIKYNTLVFQGLGLIVHQHSGTPQPMQDLNSLLTQPHTV